MPSATSSLLEVASGAVLALGASELACAELLATDASLRASSHLVLADAVLARGAEVGGARVTRDFGEFAGRISAVGLAETLTGEAFSPTTLERYATCPFRYFLERELACEVVDVPERRLAVDARVRGTIVHEVLERFVAELVGTTEPAEDRSERARLFGIADEVFDDFERRGQTGRRVLWARERRLLRRALDAERIRDARRRLERASSPVALELSFGHGGAPAVEHTVAGRRFQLSGTIDRVDRRASGALEVIDYKTGDTSKYGGLSADPVAAGRHLQLPLYALAADAALGEGTSAPILAEYRFIDRKAEVFAVEVDGATLERFDSVLAVLVESIDAGLFPKRPGRPDRFGYENCRFCDFDAVCPPDRAGEWGVARARPELAELAGLLEPDERPTSGPAEGSARG